MVAITLGSALLLRETIGSGQVLGMVLILVGIALTARTTGGN
jgi:drug/metabolite transporter (DMT)-like permease